MSLKNVGTTFRATVAIMAISLFTLVSEATAQVFCSISWTTACASVTVEVRPGSEFALTHPTVAEWILVISVTNVSDNPDPLPLHMYVESSVIRQLLFRVTDQDRNNRFPTVDFWVTKANGDPWSESGEWEVSRDEDFVKIGAMWTQDATNGDGSCRGIVSDEFNPDLPPNLPCGPDGGDHSTLAVFYLGFNDYPLILADFAAQLVNMDFSSCYPDHPDEGPGDDPYCESDWAVVPEPVTMTLVGTGLVGLGLMRRRRRRGLDIVED